jgi:branched-chain amino acid transport system permease protein
MIGELIIGGLASGSLYALIGIAIVLVLQSTDIPNFAQGEMAMFSAFVAYWLMQRYGFSWWAAVGLALAFSVVQGIVVQQVLIRPLLGAPSLNAVIATLGLNITLHSVAGLLWGHETAIFSSPASDRPPIQIFGVNVALDSASTILVSLAMIVGFTLLLKHTRAGVALRAASQNQSVARLMGIRIDRAFALAWAMGSVAGAVAGVLVAPQVFLDVNMMGPLLIKGFAGAVLGGLSSLVGVFLGGLSLGVIENLMGAYVSGSFSEALSFALIIAVLIFMPEGVFGRIKKRKV